MRTFQVCLLTVLAVFLFSCTRSTPATDPEPVRTGGGETLTVYSSHQEELIRLVVREFQERTGIMVTVVREGTGELLSRIRQEAKNPVCDVMWGGGVESLETMKEYFLPWVPGEVEKIPPEYRDPDSRWTGFTVLPMVIMYNRKLVGPDAVPKSWKDLADSRWKGKIACPDPLLSGSAFTIIATMIAAAAPDGNLEKVRAIIRNVEVAENSTSVYKGVEEGEFHIGLTIEAAIRLVSPGSDVGFVYPEDGTSAVPDGIALVQKAGDRTPARRFMDFVTGEDVQRIMSRVFMRRSVRSDVETPAGLPALEAIPLVLYDVKATARNTSMVQTLFRETRTADE